MSEPTAGGTVPSLGELLAEHAAVFRSCYGGGEAPRLFFSPGRVNLFGGHLDYNGGPVMPTAIDRGTFVAARRRPDRLVRIASTLDRKGLEVDLDEPPESKLGRWVDYPLGVLVDLVVRARGTGVADRLGGLEIMYGGNLSVGAGLSSSASICVGTAFVLDRAWDLGLGVDERVQSALRAERGFVGVQCGIMDPYAVGHARPGHVLWLDCKDATWEHLPIDFRRLSILIADSGVTRELAAGEFNRRVDQCREAFAALGPRVPGATCLRDVPLDALERWGGGLAPLPRARAEHVLREVRRTFDARDALLAGDFARMGELMTETHRSLRDLYQVSCPELDELVDAAVACDGTLGARLTGAGFGGCTVTLVEKGAEGTVRRSIVERFERRFGRVPRVETFGGDEGPRELEG